ncbi:hypothetical protein EVAR_83069_1 [Eumeta japonica]|uniref:Uncharacterized protein n=1 Tax=Eumeta variegata TaxID=151549 RepID=A0A4C1VNF0_EUMVA|nr:hypothetical protein EVAR_83069_1 [Eumeta japonica]
MRVRILARSWAARDVREACIGEFAGSIETVHLTTLNFVSDFSSHPNGRKSSDPIAFISALQKSEQKQWTYSM